MHVTCTIDASNLNRGLAILQNGYTKRTPAIAVNSAAYMVASFTFSKMPVTSQQTIDTDMQITTTPIIPTRAVKKGETNITSNVQRTAAMMIVVSRFSPNSKYSKLTGNYWPLTKPDLSSVPKGLRGVAFWNWVEEAAERMVRARHSSTGFLKICWIPALRTLSPFVANSIKVAASKYRAASGLRGRTSREIPDSGWSKPARVGTTLAYAEIANAAGVGGRNAILDSKHNDALWRVTPPILQRAINDETANVFKQIAKEELKRDRNYLKAVGFIV